MCVVSLFGLGKGVNRETGVINREELNREGRLLFISLFILADCSPLMHNCIPQSVQQRYSYNAI